VKGKEYLSYFSCGILALEKHLSKRERERERERERGRKRVKALEKHLLIKLSV